MTENIHSSNNIDSASRRLYKLRRLAHNFISADNAVTHTITNHCSNNTDATNIAPMPNPDKLVQTKSQAKEVQKVVDRTTEQSIDHPNTITTTQATVCSNIASTMLKCIGVSSNRKGCKCMQNVLIALICYQLDNNFSSLTGNSKETYKALSNYGLHISYHSYLQTVKYLSSGMYIHYPLLSYKSHNLKFRNVCLVNDDYHFSLKYHSFYKQYGIMMVIGDTVKNGYLFKVIN